MGVKRFFSHLGHRSRRSANAVMARTGLRVIRAGNALRDFTDSSHTAISAQYAAGLKPFVLHFPTQDCRILPAMGFACVEGAGNPFVDALVALRQGAMQDAALSILTSYYEAWQPKSAAQVLDLPDNARLVAAPALGFVMPWNAFTPEEALARWMLFIDNDNREHGNGGALGEGWKAWGPVSARIAAQELDRLAAVFTSISQTGYRRSDAEDGDAKGVVLWHDGAARVLISAGHHRVAAMAALGRQSTPIRVDTPVVRRSEAAQWPNVISGLFTVTEAEAVFDRLFAGRQPREYRR